MGNKKSTHKRWYITWTVFLLILGAMVLSFFIYVDSYYKATLRAQSYLQDTEKVDVTSNDDYISFLPKDIDDCHHGFVFYPGAKVESTAYAPMMSSLAEEGIVSIIVKMPYNLAIFNKSGAEKVHQLSLDIENWYIGGHSLGGAMASSYLVNHVDEYKGLVLLASYSTYDLSSSNLKTLSFLATNDQIINKENYEKNRKNLPNLTEINIDGGIHSYFGDYGHQDKDGEATITLEEQEKVVVDNISAFVLN